MARTYRHTKAVCNARYTRDGGNSWYAETNNASTATVIDVNKPAVTRTSRDAAGWRPPTPYYLFEDSYVSWRGSVDHWGENPKTFIRQKGKCDMINTDLFPVVADYDYSLRQRAETKALLKLKDQNVNYAVALAEMQRSMGLIASSLTTLIKAYSFAKKGKWVKAKAVFPNTVGHVFKARTSAIADRWLELQYGWMPLLSDIYQANNDVIRQATLCDPRLSVKSTMQRKVRSYTTTVDSAGYTISTATVKRQLCKVRLDYSLMSWFKALGSRFGVSNPALVAWELVPFSFVVDWVAPIGEWIATADADFGLVFLAGTRSERSEVTAKLIAFADRPSWVANKAKAGSATASSRTFRFNRTVYTTTPWPLPYFKNPLSTTHVLNALALLRSTLKHR